MKKSSIYMATLAMLILSCNISGNKADKKDKPAVVQDMAMNEPPEKNKDQKPDASDGIPQQKNKTEVTHQDWDKKIIKTAEVTLELKDFAAYNQTIHKSLQSYGAYIASEEQNAADDRAANNMVIKVPVEQFESLMNSFTGDGIKVLQKRISSDDVSGEMIDTKSRMEAKKQMRERYLELMRQAKNMKDILAVQQEINSIQAEIESAAGRVNYLGHQSAYSTIHLQYFQYLIAVPTPEPNSYFAKLKAGFYVGIHAMGSLFIFMVTLWPLILLTVVGVLVWKRKKTGIV